jgi:hypothetical protein
LDGERAVSVAERLDLVLGMSRRLAASQRGLDVLDRYYDGRQPLNYLAPEVRAQVGNRLASLVINWPRTIVDSVQRRTYVEGFRVGDAGDVDDELARLWQENDLDEASRFGQLDALVHARAFLLVWGNDRDPLTPRITVESAHQVVVAYEPGTREVGAALKRWSDGERSFATLYLPGEVVRYSALAKRSTARLAWEVEQVLDNPLGVVPVVPLVNRPRLLKLDGESELTDVIPLADAVNKLATDMMVASEYHAMPRRWATGIQVPAGPDRQRLQAEVAEYWDNATQHKTWLGGKDVGFGQFREASLDNFVNAIQLLTAQIAAIAGLPPHFLGINTENPASADAIRAAEATLVERAKDKQQTWGGAYEQAMRLAVAARDGIAVAAVPGELRRMETVWRDPATPTPAQSMDAAVKGVQAGVYDDVAAQEAVGLSPQQRDAIADRRRNAATTAATADVQARLNLADELQRTRGLSQNAALAAVGLLQAAGLNAAETA